MAAALPASTLAGHSVAVVVKASHTLGFNGFDDAESTKAVVIVDRLAGPEQRQH